jgi:hypothetical protein
LWLGYLWRSVGSREEVMRNRIFFTGFGASVLLLAVMVWYSSVGEWSPTIEAVLLHRDFRWSLPVELLFTWVVFMILNPPLAVLHWALSSLLRHTTLVAVGGTYCVVSGLWWALVAAIVGRWRRPFEGLGD